MERTRMSTAIIVKVGLLAALSFGLSFIELQLPIFASFLKLDLSDLPALIGTLSAGPLAGLCIELIKNMLCLLKTSTGGIGEAANFVIGSAYVVPMGIMFQKRQGLKGYMLGAVCGTILMIVTACLCNYFILIPLYSKFMSIEAIVNAAQLINPAINDLRTLILFSIAPFNLVKAIIISCIGYKLFNYLKSIL